MSLEATPEASLAELRRRYHDLRVARIIRETADASSIVFEIPDALGEAFAYESGQFLTLKVPYDGHTLYRCYSLASSPACDSEHKVTIKRIPDGRISNWVNDNLGEGDTVAVLPPAGKFVLGDETGPILLFAGGSGITPVISIVKTALARTDRPLRMLYANRDRDSIIFREELDALAAAHAGRLSITHRLDVDDGFLDATAVRDWVGTDTAATFYICGPGPFMDVVEGTLETLGATADNIYIERFESPPDGEELDFDPASGEGTKVFVNLDGKRHELDVAPGETILHAAKRAGIDPPFSCESGFCGCCMAKMVRGGADMKVNDFLQRDEVEEGWILTCQALPTDDDNEIEYPD